MRQLGLDDRDYSYYRQAAEILGLLVRADDSSYSPSTLGRRLLDTVPGSNEEKSLFQQAVEQSRDLQPFRDYLLGQEELTRTALEQRVSDISRNSDTTDGRRARTLVAWRKHLCVADKKYPLCEQLQLDLFRKTNVGIAHLDTWPEPARLPHNRPGLRVDDLVADDLSGSDDVLIVTGFASLGYLLSLLTRFDAERPRTIRIVLGNEPFTSNKKHFRLDGATFRAEVRDYWLGKGVSIYDSARVLAVRDMVEAGRVSVKLPSNEDRGLHAKMYIGARAATMGSSNATYYGMQRQYEGNSRFLRHGKEYRRYEETAQLAECYWQGARDAKAFFLGLLDKLLRQVGWRDALARACAELLEGRWASLHLLPDEWEESNPLWPSQELGIAQALWVLQNTGSVLVADATGSGKTRLGSHLLCSLLRYLAAHGRAPTRDPTIICPPAVCRKWKDELTLCDKHIEPYSDGIVSRRNAVAHDQVLRAVRRAQILVVDEAHRFLNPNERTSAMLTNAADYTLLFTATPVSKGVYDLVRIVNLLGADSLDDDALATCSELLTAPRNEELPSWTDEEKDALKRALQSFTVRRTKHMLNRLVDREPEKYLNQLERRCRYPTHRPYYYECDESKEDCEAARRIHDLAGELRGVIHIGNVLRLPSNWYARGKTDAQYLELRLRSGAALARYDVMSALRSSRAALIEHLRGTDVACERFHIAREFKDRPTGNLIQRTSEFAGHMPESRLRCVMPEWLREPEAHRQACEEESAIYQKIEQLCADISDRRESAKANKLVSLLDHHELIIAFDSTLITLSLMRRLVRERSDAVVLVATGANPEQRRKVSRQFRIGADCRRAIAMCSDSMSEGIDLQGASAIVLLDMPSVVRIAEQRIGRIDRMDSPHASIDVFWPRDAVVFALTTDEKLVRRLQLVDELLGGNVELPETSESRCVAPEQMNREYLQLADDSWIEDAFSPVRRLVEGENALIEPERYDMIRKSEEQIICAVSVVDSPEPWAFFAVLGSENDAPGWVFLDGFDSPPITGLHEVSERLRQRLARNPRDLPLTQHAAEQISRFADALQSQERCLLPRRKQRALVQMERILQGYCSRANTCAEPGRIELLSQLLRLLRQQEPDRRVSQDELATCWLNATRPYKQKYLQQPGNSRRLFLLEHLTSSLERDPLTNKQLEQAFARLPYTRTIGESIAAAIVGIRASHGDTESEQMQRRDRAQTSIPLVSKDQA